MKLQPTFTPRLYQETILATAAAHNTLVVLPTGMGKTAIAAMLAAQRLAVYPNSKIVFLAPTRPLAQQHLTTFRAFFDGPDEAFALFTGQVGPDKRQTLWEQATFIFSTPQGMENDLISRKLAVDEVSLLVFDEAHRATGDYAYVYIAQHYHERAKHERILALTASPGSDEQTIRTVCTNLYIDQIEVRTTDDPDVKHYVQELDITFVKVELTEEIKRIRDALLRCSNSKLSEAHALGQLPGGPESYTKTALLQLQASLHARTAQGERDYDVLKTISLLAEALKVQHALELCESQSLTALHSYLQQLVAQSRTSKTKAVQNLVRDENFKAAQLLTSRAIEIGGEHPKLQRLKELVAKELQGDHDKKIIIFTQFRDTATTIKDLLTGIATSKIFVGQAKKGETGLTQKQQKAMIDEFRNGDFPLLIATSVAEEGLDIPAVDAVIFYEPIPSAIRTVQRRGRTGRQEKGKVYMLIAAGTRDEAYRWTAHHKEKRMHRTLLALKQSFCPTQPEPVPQQTLTSYDGEISLTVDYREKGSLVMKALIAQGVRLELAQLPVGDYRVNDDVVVEYKTVKDFVDSIIDGRLLTQLRDLRGFYKPVLIIEGQDDLYAQRQVRPESIRGMLATIILSYHIPVLRTVSPADTAGVLLALAKRETHKEDRHFSGHAAKPWNLREQQEYLVAALPGIGAKLAKPLLERFGSVKAVLNAPVEELREVELIGEKKAQKIRDVMDAAYR